MDAPLRTYIKKKLGSVEPRYTLREVLTILKNIISDEEMFDMHNPAIILCDQELGEALNRETLNVTEIRALVYSQLERLPECLQAVMQRKKSSSFPMYTHNSRYLNNLM